MGFGRAFVRRVRAIGAGSAVVAAHAAVQKAESAATLNRVRPLSLYHPSAFACLLRLRRFAQRSQAAGADLHFFAHAVHHEVGALDIRCKAAIRCVRGMTYVMPEHRMLAANVTSARTGHR